MTKFKYLSKKTTVASRFTACLMSFFIFTACSADSVSSDNIKEKTSTLQNQQWWVGVSSEGEKMPLTKPYKVDMRGTTKGNQIQPLMLSSNGHVVWSETPYAVNYNNGKLDFDGTDKNLQITKAGTSLKEGYLFASKNYFSPSGKMPDELLFTAPQFNTWIELVYDQNQEDILQYARDIIKHGFKPGVLMIDDTWQENYGRWEFHPGRFPTPKKMMDELHSLGFKVMLWVAPFVSGDIPEYRELNSKKAFVKSAPGADAKPLMVEWWNGQSAVLDLSNPVDIKWFKDRLDYLQEEYGVDGFKFDAGDAEFYTEGYSHKKTSANQHAELYAKFGLDYPLNEYRATWKMGGQPLAQRLRDKAHTWSDLEKLVPQMNLLGVMGYPFSCPDLIGGGEFTSFINDAPIDQELIVRSTQAHALMPMMQFSAAPWRILDKTHLSAVKKATKIREKLTAYILKTAKDSAKTGEPIMRPLEYEFPHQGYENVKNQFLIGKDLLVAPIMLKDKATRKIFIPPGQWEDQQGNLIEGPTEKIINVDIDTLPFYKRR